MDVEGYCKSCDGSFNAHWHNGVDIVEPKCPVCKSKDVHTWTDETIEHESPIGDDYDDED